MLQEDTAEVTPPSHCKKHGKKSAGHGVPDVLALVALLSTIAMLTGTALFLPFPIGDALAAADPVQWSRVDTALP